MRRPLAAALAGLVVVAAGTAPGAEERSGPSRPLHPEPVKPVTLDDLFARLAGARDEVEAKGIAGLIERRWSNSGSDTADLLMSRAADAVRTKDTALAVELLDRVIALQPRWAEAWHRRAGVFQLLDDPVGAMADLSQAITREPRHFEAWSDLGKLYLSSGDKRRALGAFRHALAIHPYLASARTIVDRLSPEVDGRDL